MTHNEAIRAEATRAEARYQDALTLYMASCDLGGAKGHGSMLYREMMRLSRIADEWADAEARLS